MSTTNQLYTYDRLLPDVRAYLEQEIAASGGVAPPLTIAAVRTALDAQAQAIGPGDPVHAVAQRTIADALTVRIYTPRAGATLPVLVFFHGGGWVRGSLDTHDVVCRALARRADCVVVAVDYRLAPEHRFPAAVEDAYTALQWTAQNAQTFDGDPARIAVGGDSSGGNLAVVVALMARDRGAAMPIFQLLVYPVVTYEFDTPSFSECAVSFGLTTERMRWYWQHYLPDIASALHPYASPMHAELHGLPPAHIITAECDPLRDQGEAYAAQLQAHGVPTTLQRYMGTIHGFWSLPGLFPSSWQGVDESAAVLREVFWSKDGAKKR